MPAFPDLTELSIEETAEVFETPLCQMEINESHSVHSCMSDDVQLMKKSKIFAMKTKTSNGIMNILLDAFVPRKTHLPMLAKLNGEMTS